MSNAKPSFAIETVNEPEDLVKVSEYIVKKVKADKVYNEAFKNVATNGQVLVTMAVNALYLDANLSVGAAIAVAEITRVISCQGAVPQELLVNDSLDAKTTSAIIVAGEAFGLSVSKSNKLEEPIAIAAKGTVEEASAFVTNSFKTKGDLIFLVGEYPENITSSVYLNEVHKVTNSDAPYFELQKEMVTQDIVRGLITKELVNAAKSVTKGGVYAALVDMAHENNLGFDIEADGEVRLDAFMFGEGQGRVLVTVSENTEDQFIEFIANLAIPATLLGHVTKGKMVVDGEHFGFVNELVG